MCVDGSMTGGWGIQSHHVAGRFIYNDGWERRTAVWTRMEVETIIVGASVQEAYMGQDWWVGG